MIRGFGFLIFFIICFSCNGQVYDGTYKIKKQNPKAAGCAPPTTTTYLELNNVRAMVHTAGNLWQVPNQNYSQYEVPKNSGINALFTAALWLGGTDANDQLKLAALRYRNGQDYWTGPLSKIQAETNYENCNKYDKHFVTTQDAIREFNAWYEAGIYDQQNGTSTQSDLFQDYKVPDIIKNWPAHGDVSQGQDYYLAPFYDFNGDGNYKWEDGDFPWHDIKKTKTCSVDRAVSLYGDINYWWVMNDRGNIHSETGADPIGMEIRAQAFAFASNDEVNNMTFYNYELINRGTQTLYNTYFGFFTDGALGDPFDDYVGCDVNRGLGYYYNGDNYDGENSGFRGYGYSPPAVGVDFFEGPYQDDDGFDNAFGIGDNEALNGIGYGDGIIDNERFGMRRFLYYSNTTNGANPNQTDPINASDYYNYLRGFWKDGTKFVYGGSGHISDPDANPLVPCDFMFPGNTDPFGWGTNGVPQPNWTEQTANNTPNDRRFVQSAGPFILKPGAVNNITVGVVWARSSKGEPFESVESLRIADDKAQALFENCFKVLDAPHAPDMQIQELNNELILTLSNPINSNNFNEQYEEFDPFIVSNEPNSDKTYNFQGYQIFQLKDAKVGLAELSDPSKARLVAQCDIKDDISKIINFEFSDELNASIPVMRVNGENKGIKHSFSIKNDLFAQGSPRLVNFKRYYYLAIAYAYNNYRNYVPDDPLAIDGQKKRYIASRKAAVGEIKALEAVPHNPKPESGGTYQNIEYGSSPQITRLDGYGNGNRSLEFTDETMSTILSEGWMENPTYDYGKGPINIKVVDPLNLASGYFECKFKDYVAPNSGNGADTASWVIYRYDQKGGSLMDSVESERAISSDNEQIIPEWGISVQIYQTKYFFPAGSGNVAARSTDMIDASLTFSDSSKRWLAGVPDNDAFFPTNWIRSGDYDDTNTTQGVAEYLNSINYKDEIGADPNQKFERILDGTIAPHRLVGYQADYMPLAYCNTSIPGNAKTNASISFLPSVDIVLTSDKSKWTRCPVIELGRTAALNVGAAKPGARRNSYSVSKTGAIQTDTNIYKIGMGWFPGYAVDLETGARLYMAFGENSFLGGENGSDMIWNPTDRVVSNVGTPLMGGMHPIYVFSCDQAKINGYTSGFDMPAYIPSVAENDATNELLIKLREVEKNNSTSRRQFYGSLTWIAYPLANQGYELDPVKGLPTTATIKLRINKEYKNYTCTGLNAGKPMYSWSMDKIATQVGQSKALQEVLDMINVVPNPYYAFSEYERSRLDTRVKITNLPEKCTVSIYTTSGKLVRTFKKDSPVTSLDWDLTNHKAIPVAGDVYLIYVEVPDIGTRVLKFFGGMRQVDLQGI
jgi:hypothetical protein